MRVEGWPTGLGSRRTHRMVPVVLETLAWTPPQRWVSCQGQASNLHQTEQNAVGSRG